MTNWVDRPTRDLSNKNVTVVGGARSGMAVCRLLAEVKATAFLTDQKEPVNWTEKKQELSQLKSSIDELDKNENNTPVNSPKRKRKPSKRSLWKRFKSAIRKKRN